MCEPLKNKRRWLFGDKITMGKNEGIIFWNLPFTELDVFDYSSVKSAVEGLKQELTSFMEKNPAFETWVYRRVMKIIDKWLQDVIE